MLVDCLVFLQLFLHLIFDFATNAIPLQIQRLDMLVLLERIHELLHLFVANRIISQVNMLDKAELSNEFCQKIEILDSFLSKLEAHCGAEVDIWHLLFVALGGPS